MLFSTILNCWDFLTIFEHNELIVCLFLKLISNQMSSIDACCMPFQPSSVSKDDIQKIQGKSDAEVWLGCRRRKLLLNTKKETTSVKEVIRILTVNPKSMNLNMQK